MNKWKVNLENNNSIIVDAKSEEEAKEQAAKMFQGGEVVSVEDQGKVKPPPLTLSAIRSHGRVAPVRTQRAGKKIGRNEQCPCGSGKKYKKCCSRQRRR